MSVIALLTIQETKPSNAAGWKPGGGSSLGREIAYQRRYKEGNKEMAVKLGYVTAREFDEWVIPANMVGNIK